MEHAIHCAAFWKVGGGGILYCHEESSTQIDTHLWLMDLDIVVGCEGELPK